MKRALFFSLLLVVLAGCASNRVLVRDCHDAGPDLKNCEKVKDL